LIIHSPTISPTGPKIFKVISSWHNTLLDRNAGDDELKQLGTIDESFVLNLNFPAPKQFLTEEQQLKLLYKAVHQLNDIENPKLGNREQLLYDLAYTQWSVDEIKQGLPWDHLYENINCNNLEQ